MDFGQHIIYGLLVALEPVNLLYCFIGVFTGTLIGVLPGIGPVGTMSLLLPVTFHVSPVGAIIMLAGIYYGCQYGGSITAILANIPGEASSVTTCLDGYQMAKQGRAGVALGVSAIGSFVAGTLTIVALMFLAYPLAQTALKFGPPEYFALMCLGLVMLTFLSQKSMFRSLMMALVGLLIGLVGLDPFEASPRFDFGYPELMDGVGIVPLVMGLFGISEVLMNLGETREREVYKTEISGLLSSLKETWTAKWAVLRGTVLGFFLGILPGGGAVLSSFVSYALEKRISKHPEKFGTGAIEGVAAPESANNAAAQSCLIPLLSLGIPPNVVMAVLYGGLLIHRIQPGPFLVKDHPDVFWGLVMSMYIGNIMLLALNLPLIGIWVRILKIRYAILFPLILLFCLIGVYSVNNSVFDIYLMIFFGLAGYLLRKAGFEPAPLAMAYVLSPLLETSFRQSLSLSGGSPGIFLAHPISVVCLGLALVLLVFQIASSCRSRWRLPLSPETEACQETAGNPAMSDPGSKEIGTGTRRKRDR
ncbi:MAG: tripartite tricarboxylate transporter permease [Deltaproteobacteria bacterium]|nr:tripartite tricarboxylate transporter permease [Deltaproteobacteria bacterium]